MAVKRCLDCKYHIIGARNDHFCKEPTVMEAGAVVTGEKEPQKCWDLREAGRACGLEGRLFVGNSPAVPAMPEANRDHRV